MIGQPIRCKGLTSLFGNLVYLATLSFPSWAGLALMLYALTMYEIAPRRITAWLTGNPSSDS